MKVRAVLFDLDGTLVDHETAAAEGLWAWLPTLGLEPTGEAVARWATVQEPHLAEWRAGRISFAEQRRRRIRDYLGVDGSDAELDELFGGYLTCYEQHWRAFDDAAEALKAFPGNAVLTNGTRVQQLKKLSRTGLAELVGPVFTVDDLGVAKPDPDAFRRACALWGLAPAEVLSVGDDYELDVLAARAAGLQAVHLDRYGDDPHGITSLSELSAR